MAEFTLDLPDLPEDVFEWHRRPGALPRLLPPWQPVRPVHEASNLRDGVAVLRMPAGRRWVAQHLADEYVEGRQFADRLASRPMVVPFRWSHLHEIKPFDDGCRLTDRVSTDVPMAFLDAMFGYRHRQLAGDLAAHRWARSQPRRVVAITGSSGLVGSALAPFLTTGGHRVIRLVRREPVGTDERYWDPSDPDPAALTGVDAVVHLAGASIAGRFNPEHKRQVHSSRVEPTRRLARAAASAGVPVFVSASAVGFYGADRGDELLDERSEPGDGFLAGVVRDWETAALEPFGQGTRVVLVRTGVVQSPRGGALRLQRPLFTAGLGGPLGGGNQWLSWIGIDDLVDIYHRAIVDPNVHGAVNAVAPHPVRQSEYAAALGQVLRRPAILPTPAFAPRLLLGREGLEEVAMASQRVSPVELESLGHEFRYPRLEHALSHVLGRPVGDRS